MAAGHEPPPGAATDGTDSDIVALKAGPVVSCTVSVTDSEVVEYIAGVPAVTVTTPVLPAAGQPEAVGLTV